MRQNSRCQFNCWLHIVFGSKKGIRNSAVLWRIQAPCNIGTFFFSFVFIVSCECERSTCMSMRTRRPYLIFPNYERAILLFCCLFWPLRSYLKLVVIGSGTDPFAIFSFITSELVILEIFIHLGHAVVNENISIPQRWLIIFSMSYEWNRCFIVLLPLAVGFFWSNLWSHLWF